MASNIINLYIPRILGNVKRSRIVNTFSNMKIGDIFYIDMYKKFNENNNPYYFAFISIKLYDSLIAEDLEKTLNEKGVTRLIYDYDKNHYWEVKKHIDRSLRQPRIPSPTSVTSFDFENLQNSQFVNTIFTKKDKDDLEKEYEELENEIRFTCEHQWIPIYYF